MKGASIFFWKMAIQSVEANHLCCTGAALSPVRLHCISAFSCDRRSNQCVPLPHPKRPLDAVQGYVLAHIILARQPDGPNPDAVLDVRWKLQCYEPRQDAVVQPIVPPDVRGAKCKMGEADVFQEWDDLAADFKELENTNKIYLEKLDELSAYQEKCMKGIHHQKYRMSIINKNIGEARRKGGEVPEADREKVFELENNIIKRKAQLTIIEQTLPKQNGLYLKIILGNVNVSILNKEEKFKYKNEYETFKLILSGIGFVLSLMNLCTRFRPLELSYIFLLVWYYCTLTIRESILKVNGSRIKGWWRFHHFFSTVVAGILLIWPDTDTWRDFRNQFMWFNAYISVVQNLQFIYQRGVLYRLKALGERDNMDITIEGFHSWMWRGLSFLIPFLFMGYLFQLYNAYTLFTLTYYPSATWHVSVLSIMFFILFVGNTITMLMVIPSKKWEKMKLEYSLIGFFNQISRKVRENGSNGKRD